VLASGKLTFWVGPYKNKLIKVSILCTIPIDPKKWNENAALIRWIASPINLLDLNIIKGKYKKTNTNLNKFQCIGGTEGVGLVERVNFCFKEKISKKFFEGGIKCPTFMCW